MPKGQRFRVELRSADEATLRTWAAARRGEHRLWQRAQVVLLSAAGETVAAISAATGLTPQAVSAWRRRYLEEGLVACSTGRAPAGPCRSAPRSASP